MNASRMIHESLTSHSGTILPRVGGGVGGGVGGRSRFRMHSRFSTCEAVMHGGFAAIFGGGRP